MRPCRKCSSPLTESNSRPTDWANRIYLCRTCDNEERNERRAKNPEAAQARMKKWREANPEKVRERGAVYRENHRVSINEKAREYRINNRPHLKVIRLQWKDTLKREVMAHYSGGPVPECKRCHYLDLRALTIDHIEGNGSAHRRELKGGGVRMYQWLKANNYPLGFQVLCMNCQFIKKCENVEHSNPVKANLG